MTKILLLTALIACTPASSRTRHTDATREIAGAPPVIDSVRPDSAVVPSGAVVEVTLYGSGFVPGQPGRNTVHFAGGSLTSIAASADGGRIVFVVPDQIIGSGGAPPIKLISGAYPISVQTAAGTSNIVTIRIYR